MAETKVKISQLNIAEVQGYDATKQQYLVNDTGTLLFSGLQVRKTYSGFSASGYIGAKSSFPSYTAATALIHLTSFARGQSSAGQNIISVRSGNKNMGFCQTDTLELYNGSTNFRSSYVLPNTLTDIWLKVVLNGTDSTANLYYLLDDGYTRDTVPSDLSAWNFAVSATNYNWYNQTFYIGNPTDNTYSPINTTIHDLLVTYDNNTFIDLQDESTFTSNGLSVSYNNVLADLPSDNNKADTALSNLTDTGKIKSANLAMPSSVYDSLTPPSSGGGARTQYTAPSDGYFVISYNCSSSGRGAAVINESKGEMGSYLIHSTGATYYTGWCIAEKGDTIGVWLTSNTPTVNWLRFYYANGTKNEKQGA